MNSSPPVGLGPHLSQRRARHLEVVHRAVTVGLASAAQSLSAFVGQGITIEAPRLGLCAVEDLVDCALGSALDQQDWSAAEAIATGIYVQFNGDVMGHFLLLLPPLDARALVAPLVRDLAPDDARMEALILSALGEVGNITASSLLNALADAAQLRIAASCPAVVTDMAGAILELPVLDLAQSGDQALYVETIIKTALVCAERDQPTVTATETPCITTGSLAIIPHLEGLEALIQGLSRQEDPRRRGGRR